MNATPALRCIVCGDVITTPLGRIVCSTYCRARHAGGQNRNHHSDGMRIELARLWSTGLPITEIGRLLHVSRNVVASLRRRMGLVPRATLFPMKAAAPRKPAPPRPRTTPPAPMQSPRPEHLTPPAPAPNHPARGVSFPTVRTCQYPFGERGDWRWCGKPTVAGGPYCEECRRICWVISPRYRTLEAMAA